MVMEGGRKEAVLGAYAELKLKHPELPSQLREFQVACGDSCVTIFALARHFSQHDGVEHHHWENPCCERRQFRQKMAWPRC